MSHEFHLKCGRNLVRVAWKESSVEDRPRLFLKAGERVTHTSQLHWGVGVVEEVMTSSVPGGTCLVRIRFQDGRLRVFHNDLDNEGCCYYFGLRHYEDRTAGGNSMRHALLALLGSEE